MLRYEISIDVARKSNFIIHLIWLIYGRTFDALTMSH